MQRRMLMRMIAMLPLLSSGLPAVFARGAKGGVGSEAWSADGFTRLA
jgi:hypothetical protein